MSSTFHYIVDSPKPPPARITLTFPVLNQHTRHVIVCGAGASKAPITKKALKVTASTDYSVPDGTRYTVQVQRDAFPCARVHPATGGSLTWMVDAEAVQTLPLTSEM